MPHKDPVARREYQQAWYRRNRESERRKARERQRRHRQQVDGWCRGMERANRAFKQRVATFIGCMGCGKRDKHNHFHHRDPATKVDSVANLVKRKREILKAEMRKCTVLCAECHTKEHQQCNSTT